MNYSAAGHEFNVTESIIHIKYYVFKQKPVKQSYILYKDHYVKGRFMSLKICEKHKIILIFNLKITNQHTFGDRGSKERANSSSSGNCALVETDSHGRVPL